MPWQTAVAVQLQAGNTIINPSGVFIYSSAPAAGNLIISEAPAAGTDQFGNAFVQGLGIYLLPSGINEVISAGVQNGIASFFVQNQTSAVTLPPFFGGQAQGGVAGTQAFINSGASSGLALSSQLELQDSVGGGVAGGLVQVNAGQFNFNLAGTAKWDDNNTQLNLPAGGGPFIQSEGFHTLGNPAGITGTCRIKKLPWNAIWLEGQVTWSGTTGATLTFGAPPDSTYSPTVNLHRPVGSTATPSAVSNPGRLFIPTAGGGPQLITPTVTGANTSWGWSVIYPNN